MLRGQRSVESQRRTRHLQMMEPTPYRPSVPFRRTPRSAQNHHHSATAAAGSIAATRAPSRDKRRAPMDSDDRGEGRQGEDLLVEVGSRAYARTHGGRIRGRRGAPATRGWPGNLRSSRGPTDPLRVRVLGRRAIHDVSIDYCGVNGAILAPVRRASHTFDFFNFKQFDRSRKPTNGLHPLTK